MKNLYSIRDVVAQAVGPVMVFPTDAVAVRSFGDVAQDAQSMVNRHTADFELVFLGSLDEDGSIFDVPPVPRVVITGAQWKAAQAPVGDGQLSLIGG